MPFPTLRQVQQASCWCCTWCVQNIPWCCTLINIFLPMVFFISLLDCKPQYLGALRYFGQCMIFLYRFCMSLPKYSKCPMHPPCSKIKIGFCLPLHFTCWESWWGEVWPVSGYFWGRWHCPVLTERNCSVLLLVPENHRWVLAYDKGGQLDSIW